MTQSKSSGRIAGAIFVVLSGLLIVLPQLFPAGSGLDVLRDLFFFLYVVAFYFLMITRKPSNRLIYLFAALAVVLFPGMFLEIHGETVVDAVILSAVFFCAVWLIHVRGIVDERTTTRLAVLKNKHGEAERNQEELEQDISGLELLVDDVTNLFHTLRQLEESIEYSHKRDVISKTFTSNFPRLSGRLVVYDEKGLKEPKDLLLLGENPPEQGLDEQALQFMFERQRSVLKDGSKLEELSTQKEGIEASCVCFPFVYENKVQGALVVEDGAKKEGRDIFLLSQIELKKLCLFVDQVTLSLRNASLYETIKEISRRDGLTGLFVHRVFHERLYMEVVQARRFNLPLSLFVLDIDHFKEFNDNYGHLAGDAVLKHLSGILTENVRSSDTVVRYGGEEFAIILPETEKELAVTLAERIRRTIENSPLPFEGKTLNVTISIGVSGYPVDARDKESLLVAGDKALYKAKETGRNKVCVFKKKI